MILITYQDCVSRDFVEGFMNFWSIKDEYLVSLPTNKWNILYLYTLYFPLNTLKAPCLETRIAKQTIVFVNSFGEEICSIRTLDKRFFVKTFLSEVKGFVPLKFLKKEITNKKFSKNS